MLRLRKAKQELKKNISAEITRTQIITCTVNKGGKFLAKLWFCVGGEYYKIIWFYQLNVNWPP